ncbi:conserved hypothetical protein [Corynebacterium striatum]|nr:conserved hypothetical protein [Corynebacterium striatum]
MSNRDRAAHLIMEAARESEVPTETAINAVEALANAGLLAPDLPEPDREDDRKGAAWYLNTQIGYIASGGPVIDVYGLSCQRQSFRLTFTKEEAEITAHGFLAAAKYQEEA